MGILENFRLGGQERPLWVARFGGPMTESRDLKEMNRQDLHITGMCSRKKKQ